ncbi:MAG: uroporphyrinogen decarboxylase family protein [Candidatus Bathyarchaeia archaeon]
MNSKERIKAILNFEEPDRVGMHDEFWLETIKRWKEEGGLPPDAPEPPEGADYKYIAPKYFDMDMVFVEIDPSPRFEKKVLYSEGDIVVILDEWGQKKRSWIHDMARRQVIDNIVKTEEDWEKIADRFQPTLDRIVDPPYEKLRDLRKSEKFVMLLIFNPWEWGFRIVGFTNLIKYIYRNPAFVRKMFNTLVRFQSELMKIIIDEKVVDGIWMWGDSAYNKGPFISPEKYRELITPVHKVFCDIAKKNDLPVLLHTDGDITLLIPQFIEAGITCLNPIESDILDVVQLKEQYGDKLVFCGGIDVKKLSEGPEEARRETLEKIKKLAYGGGFIYHSDHSVPPSVSFESYMASLRAVKKYGKYIA